MLDGRTVVLVGRGGGKRDVSVALKLKYYIVLGRHYETLCAPTNSAYAKV